MNRDAIDLRKFFFDTVFQRGGYVMDLSNRQRAAHRAMAGSEDVVFHLANTDVVAIDELVDLGRQAVNEFFDRPRELLHFARAGVGCGDVAAKRLDMDIHVG